MKKVLIFLLIAAGLAAAWFWFKSRAPAAAAEEAAPAASVETAVLKKQTISETLNVFGVIAAASSSDQTIAATYDSVIRKVLAPVGSRVTAGEPLLEIEPSPDAKLLLESARTTADLAGKALAAAQQRYDLKLANSQDLLTARQTEVDARQKLASYEARGLGGETKIVAPFAGVVSKLESSPGALVVAGTALVSITAGDHLEARLGVEVADLERVSAGQYVTLQSANRSADADPVGGKVLSAGALVDAVSGTAEVRVTLPENPSLLLGEHVQGLIQLNEKEALVAPRAAVLPDDDEFVLYTVKEGKAVKHVVTMGINSGDVVEVEGADLKEGDVVVTLGNYELADGMAIQLKEKEADADEKPKGKEDEKAKGGEDGKAAKENGKAAAEDKGTKEAKS
jgi:RND family efflux transporter MFP subunit